MAEGARAATDAGADIIDINMGCPAKKVTSGYSGSALMRDLDHALELIEATVAATHLPVTLKMRLGWDDQSLNAAELARRAEQAGVRMLTVHGRTRCQFYSGAADWAAIGEVKEAVSIPVIANGDLVSFDAARADARALRRRRRDDRARRLRPPLASRRTSPARCRRAASPSPPCGRSSPSWSSTTTTRCSSTTAPIVGARAARKHLGWYMANAPSAGRERDRRFASAIMTETRPPRRDAARSAPISNRLRNGGRREHRDDLAGAATALRDHAAGALLDALPHPVLLVDDR